MKVYEISIEGCHDTTYIEIALTPIEYALIKRISEMSIKNSHYTCMPYLEIKELKGYTKNE